MKALKTKVILSAAVLLFAMVATIGSTYAWFTVAQTNSVEAMTLNVQAAESLLIKVADPATLKSAQDVTNASTYYTTVTTGMVTGVYTGLTGAAETLWRLAPVTAINANYNGVSGEMASLNKLSINLNSLRALTPVLAGEWADDGTAAVFGADANKVGGSVIVVGFWVMSQASTSKNIGVTALSITANNTSYPSRNAITNASRVSFKLGGDPAYIYANTGAVDYGYEYLINLPGYYADTANIYDTDPVALLGFNKIDQLTQGYDGSKTLPADIWTAEELSLIATHRTAGTASIGSLASDTPELMVVTIFVEGWDAQTTNAVISAQFSLTFSIGFVA